MVRWFRWEMLWFQVLPCWSFPVLFSSHDQAYPWLSCSRFLHFTWSYPCFLNRFWEQQEEKREVFMVRVMDPVCDLLYFLQAFWCSIFPVSCLLHRTLSRLSKWQTRGLREYDRDWVFYQNWSWAWGRYSSALTFSVSPFFSSDFHGWQNPFFHCWIQICHWRILFLSFMKFCACTYIYYDSLLIQWLSVGI